MSKFKESDEIVRTKIECKSAPIGYKTIIEVGTLSRKLLYPNIYGRLVSVNEDDWELAEYTSKPVTVTYEGNVYEIGKSYLFSDTGSTWAVDVLMAINEPHDFKFIGSDCNWRKCKSAVLGELGTITPAPIELINGAAYIFNCNGKNGISGIYDKDTDRLYSVGGIFRELDYCTKIKPLTVAESK
jgi:hypothetical protein